MSDLSKIYEYRGYSFTISIMFDHGKDGEHKIHISENSGKHDESYSCEDGNLLTKLARAESLCQIWANAQRRDFLETTINALKLLGYKNFNR